MKERKASIEAVRDVRKDLARAQVLESLSLTEGGKALVSMLAADVVGAVETLASGNGTLSHAEFIALACRIKERTDVIGAINASRSESHFLRNELKELIEQLRLEGEDVDDKPQE